MPLKTTQETLDYSILYSVSRVFWLGYEVLKARTNQTDPVKAILDYANGVILKSGKVSIQYCIYHIF